jgi:ubiquinone/menaquinone biosynthesis C-methylase UbiE
MPWEIFEKTANSYEGWYSAPQGERADRAERGLLDWLLTRFPTAQRVLEIGCGTGHFTGWLAGKGLRVAGLDRAPAMLAEAHKLRPEIPLILGDAHRLPIRDGTVDLALFMFTLEYLDDPAVALAEAVRVARQGLVVVALNHWSLGALFRRWTSPNRQRLLSQARDQTVFSLRALLKKAGGLRWRGLSWESGLLPGPLYGMRLGLPVGDVIGVAARLGSP